MDVREPDYDSDSSDSSDDDQPDRRVPPFRWGPRLVTMTTELISELVNFPEFSDTKNCFYCRVMLQKMQTTNPKRLLLSICKEIELWSIMSILVQCQLICFTVISSFKIAAIRWLCPMLDTTKENYFKILTRDHMSRVAGKPVIWVSY